MTTPAPPDALSKWTGVALVAVAFLGSFGHAVAILDKHGQHATMGKIIALMPEIMVILGLRAMFSGRTSPASWAALIVGGSFSLAANLSTAELTPWGLIGAGYPSVASVVAIALGESGRTPVQPDPEPVQPARTPVHLDPVQPVHLDPVRPVHPVRTAPAEAVRTPRTTVRTPEPYTRTPSVGKDEAWAMWEKSLDTSEPLDKKAMAELLGTNEEAARVGIHRRLKARERTSS